MSACAMLTYNNVTPTAWDDIVAEAAKMNIAIGADSGSATAKNFTVNWNYDRSGQTLTLQCVDHPFYISCSLINAHLNDAVERCLQTHQIAMSDMVTLV